MSRLMEGVQATHGSHPKLGMWVTGWWLGGGTQIPQILEGKCRTLQLLPAQHLKYRGLINYRSNILATFVSASHFLSHRNAGDEHMSLI